MTGTSPPDANATEPADLPSLDVLYVDAMNVIGSRPDGWWRDRDAAVLRFVESLGLLARKLASELVVVIDGRPIAGLPEGRAEGIVVRYAARRGPDAADDRIIELLDEQLEDDDATRLGLVTADRDLRARASSRGATTLGPARLWAAMDAVVDGS